MLAAKSTCAIDATGFETRHCSRHFSEKKGGDRFWSKWPKLTAAFDISSHAILAAHVCLGPCHDSSQFPPVIEQAVRVQNIRCVLADKGYDSEALHRLCRETLGIRRTVIPLRRRSRRTRKSRWAVTRYRHQMKKPTALRGYGQRWQAESGFSRHKRVFGSALRARKWVWQQGELLFRVATHNICLVT